METLLVDRDDGVVTVTLNRPDKKNAINGRMWRELIERLRRGRGLRRDDRVLVITGAGDGFCSGADLTDTERAETVQGGVGGSAPVDAARRPRRAAAARAARTRRSRRSTASRPARAATSRSAATS